MASEISRYSNTRKISPSIKIRIPWSRPSSVTICTSARSPMLTSRNCRRSIVSVTRKWKIYAKARTACSRSRRSRRNGPSMRMITVTGNAAATNNPTRNNLKSSRQISVTIGVRMERSTMKSIWFQKLYPLGSSERKRKRNSSRDRIRIYINFSLLSEAIF